MRRWVKVSWAILALAAVACCAFLATDEPDDPFNWIRRYGGQELPPNPPLSNAEARRSIVFVFRQIPSDLLNEIKVRGRFLGRSNNPDVESYELPNDQTANVWLEWSHVTVTQSHPTPQYAARGRETWWQERWRVLTARLGFRRSHRAPYR